MSVRMGLATVYRLEMLVMMVHFYIHIKSKKREGGEEKIYGNSTADKGKPK